MVDNIFYFFFNFEALLFYLIHITKAKKRYVNVRIQLSDFDEEKHFEDGKGNPICHVFRPFKYSLITAKVDMVLS